MTKRPEPVMACAECGPVILEYVTNCPLCPDDPAHVVSWFDLAVGLEYQASFRDYHDQRTARLFRDAANLIRSQQDTIESMQQAQGGAKRRRQEEKARRLAEVIRETYASPLPDPPLSDAEWRAMTSLVNQRYPNDPIREPSHETKALVAAKFAEPQEAG